MAASRAELDRLAARTPISGWLCLACGHQTDGVLDQPVPCCPDQFALRVCTLPQRTEHAA